MGGKRGEGMDVRLRCRAATWRYISVSLETANVRGEAEEGEEKEGGDRGNESKKS